MTTVDLIKFSTRIIKSPAALLRKLSRRNDSINYGSREGPDEKKKEMWTEKKKCGRKKENAFDSLILFFSSKKLDEKNKSWTEKRKVGRKKNVGRKKRQVGGNKPRVRGPPLCVRVSGVRVKN